MCSNRRRHSFVFCPLLPKTSIRVAQRADQLLATGDIEGRAVWLRILGAVKEMMATKPPGSVH